MRTNQSPHQYAIYLLNLDRQHWVDDRETDPEDADRKIEELDDAIETLENYPPPRP